MKNCVEAIDHLCSLIQSVVLCSFGNSNKSRTAAHFKGYIHFNSPIYNNNNFQDYNNNIHNNGNNIYEDFNNNAIEVKVLFDTGALCANYMSNDLFLDIKNRLHKNQYRQQKSNVALADDSKVITSSHVVTLPLTVVDDNQNTNSMNNGLYVVINMKDNDIIVGLPAIMTSFWKFFKKAIDHQIDKQNMCSLNTTSDKDLMSDLDPEYPDNYSLLEPWTVKLEEAPEEDEVPLPAQFDFASSFLGKSRQEAIQEYEEMFATHVDKQMAVNTDVIHLLRTKGRKVFIPDNWDGIQGIEPLQIQFSPDLPDRLKPKARPINPRLWECAEKEFKRLCGYFYEESRSPHASCLVLAPKATKPFIRFCGDYGIINKYIPTGHYYIPHIRYELDRIMGYSVYIDIDLTNAFHQIRLHPDTAAKLSVQTPWGQFQPRFMPEGIGPGSAVLQETVRKLFADFQWAIIIFDNVLILANSYKDAYSKLDIFLDRCIQHNVVLKFAKSWNGKQGHWGLRETWKRLNQRFPGHGLPMQYISQCIAECPTCQKTRKERREHLVPMVRHLKPPHSRSAIGIDDVSITPHGKNGHTHITVIVNLFTKFVYLHPIKGCTAINLAAAVWTYWCYFGCTDMVISDQGPNLRSDLFNELTSLVGLRHVFSIADRHVNGCERLIKEAQRHLRALVYDSRIEDVFDDPTVIPSIQYIMNSKVSSESSEAHTPFELMFGSTDAVYTNLLDNVMDNAPDVSHVLLRRLNENLLMLRNASREYQQRLVDQRLRDNNPDTDAPPNVYQPGDYVTFDAGPKPHPKLSCRYKGPYEVVSQQRNDVHCRNLLTDAVTQFSLTDLEPFYCSSREEAQEAAMRDNQQFVAKTIHSYTGDSRTRTSMTFTVEFADGDIRQLPWSPDLLCEAYYEFCAARPHLHHLTLDTRMANKFKTQMNKQPITAISVGDVIYLDLRFFGDLWYEALELPDSATTTYVLEAKYTHWYHARSKRKISLKLTLLPEHTYALDGYTVFCWGTRTTFDPSTMVLVDVAMLVRYPQINQD